MNGTNLNAIWTVDDFRKMVTDLRAAAAADLGALAPVIDIATREVLR